MSHHTGVPLTTEQRKYLGGMQGFTLSEPAEYKAHIVDSYLCYVDKYLDVELTLSYKRDIHGNILNPKYQLRLINKAGFNPDKPNEPSVVFSVGVPFQAFRPETTTSVLTRVLNIGEGYILKWDKQIQLFGQMAAEALETMQNEYKIVVSGNDKINGMKLPVTRLMLAPASGLKRETPFDDEAIPYAWLVNHQSVSSPYNTPKAPPEPPLKPKTTRAGAVGADGDDDMPAATAVPAEGGGGRTPRAARKRT